jgi:hypothetical protein
MEHVSLKDCFKILSIFYLSKLSTIPLVLLYSASCEDQLRSGEWASSRKLQAEESVLIVGLIELSNSLGGIIKEFRESIAIDTGKLDIFLKLLTTINCLDYTLHKFKKGCP